MSFNPSTLTVPVGSTVFWTNLDGMNHSVVSRANDGGIDNSGALASPLLGQGDAWSFTFTSAEVYPYRCGPHAGMTGSITVTD